MFHFHSPPVRRVAVAMLVAALVCGSVPSSYAQCDADTEARLAFLEGRLEEGEKGMDWWWGSWMAVYTIGLAYNVYDGAREGDNSNQAAAFFQAGKSALGITQLLLRPHVGRHGADPMQEIPKTSAESCAQRLALAEKHLRIAAKEGNVRKSWTAHVTSLALNLGVAIAIDEGWDDEGDAWRDFAVSEVAAEINIWSHPTRAVKDWDEYQRQYNNLPAAAAEPQFRLATMGRGIGLMYRF